MNGLLDCPHYTVPRCYQDAKVPEMYYFREITNKLENGACSKACGELIQRRWNYYQTRKLTKEESRATI